jgi:hypothetical protein
VRSVTWDCEAFSGILHPLAVRIDMIRKNVDHADGGAAAYPLLDLSLESDLKSVKIKIREDNKKWPSQHIDNLRQI